MPSAPGRAWRRGATFRLKISSGTRARGIPGEFAHVVDEQALRIRHDVDRHPVASIPADRQSRTAVAEVTASLVSLLSAVYAKRGMAFSVEVDEALEFHGDRADLEDMLGNILDNACKWAREHVAVTAGVVDDKLLITVSDDGPGIPEADLDAVLRRGTRLDHDESREAT